MLNLFNWLKTLGPTGQTAAELYGSIVAQARQPIFYRRFGVPDTTTGRYEVLSLHIAAVLLALRRREGTDGPLGRALTEVFVADMDDTMRELAFGDMSVPRRVKKVAAGLRERTLAYGEALASGRDDVVRESVAGFVELPASAQSVQLLSSYLRQIHDVLSDETATAELQRARVDFPDPSTIV